MDANGTRFHLLLGDADWRGCHCARAADALPADWMPVFGEPLAPAEWNADAGELGLRRRPYRFEPPPGDTPPLDCASARRGAAADLFGNIYWIDDVGTGLRVRSAGTDAASTFWPAAIEPTTPAAGAFGPRDAAPEYAPSPLRGLAVTVDHRLVVGTLAPAGVLVFDLFAGGPPEQLLWPSDVAFSPFDMAAGPDGRLCILDCADPATNRCWLLDRSLGVVRLPATPAAAPADAQTFQPVGVAAARRAHRAPTLTAIELKDATALQVAHAAAVELLPDGAVLVLDRGPGPHKFSTVHVYREGKLAQSLPLEVMAQEVAPEDRAAFSLVGHDMVFVPEARGTLASGSGDPGGEPIGVLHVAEQAGNQAYAFRMLQDKQGQITLRALPHYLPMRRFGGRGLILSGGQPHYDFAEGWVPLVRQPRPRHVPEAFVFTRAFDGREPECVWHRLLIDGCIPPGTSIRVYSRSGDDADNLDDQPWCEEPPLYRRRDGRELPWLPAAHAGGRGDGPGTGTWELLLRHACGRYLRLRLDLTGNERSTPRLQALRVWYPRFSYLDHYLPAVYREDADSAAFLDGFLANLEGFWTATEDRIAAANILLDWRSAPSDSLDWLAGWFGIALDPTWGDARRREFIRHAMRLFQWRGTVPGLRAALALALDGSLPDDALAAPERMRESTFGVRIVERFRTRKLPDVLFGDATQLELNPSSEEDRHPWSPGEGTRALRERYRRFLALDAQAPLPEVPIVAPNGDAAAGWSGFCEQALGFTPWAAGLELDAWRSFLAARYIDPDGLNRAWRTAFERIEDVGLPANAPADAAVLADWTAYMRQAEPARTPGERIAWQGFLRSRHATVSTLNAQYGTSWTAFDLIPLPGRLPADGPALDDWFQFESAVLAMRGTAHRFSVLLPMPTGADAGPDEPARRLEIARRVVELEKPAHTVFDLRFYWAMFRVGEARLEYDTQIDDDAREQLVPALVLGRGYLGESRVAPTPTESRTDRNVLGRDRLVH